MNFNTAFISMKQGHKVQRSCWKGYWKIENGEIIMYTKEGKVVNIRDSKDMMYTISNMLCDDWQICDESDFDIKIDTKYQNRNVDKELKEIAKEEVKNIKKDISDKDKNSNNPSIMIKVGANEVIDLLNKLGLY